MSPLSWSAHILSAIIAFVGLLAFALATGIVYGRFSKPKAQILFSQKAVVCKYRDTTALMFRIVNKRNHKIIDVECGLFCTWVENNNGLPKRNFKKLELERQIIFLFPMNWTIVHPIREDSPFYGQSQVSLMAINLELIVQIKGYDESYNQTIHANSSYLAEEIVWGEKFSPMVTSDETGTVVHLDKIDERIADV
jgi:inward rectifier potassium channel